MEVVVEGRRQRGAVVHFRGVSHLMAVGIEGRRQRGGFLHWVFEVFSLVSRFEQLKVAGSAEQWCIGFEVFSFNDSIR